MIDVRGSYENIGREYPGAVWDGIVDERVSGLSIVTVKNKLIDITKTRSSTNPDVPHWVAGTDFGESVGRRIYVHQVDRAAYMAIHIASKPENADVDLDSTNDRDIIQPDVLDTWLKETLIGGVVLSNRVHEELVKPRQGRTADSAQVLVVQLARSTEYALGTINNTMLGQVQTA